MRSLQVLAFATVPASEWADLCPHVQRCLLPAELAVTITQFQHLVLNRRRKNLEEVGKLLGKQLKINLHPLENGAIRLEPAEAPWAIKPGEHLVVMEAGEDGYQHHGLYLGLRDGVHSVVELTSTNGIEVPRYATFVDGKQYLYVIPYSVGDGPEEDEQRKNAIDIAEFFIKHRQYVREYDLLTWNCECFALMCKTGKYQASTQIQHVFDAIHADITSQNSVLVGHLSKAVGVVSGIISSSS